MTRFLIASDKFKGSLTSFEACRAIAEGLLAACPGYRVQRCPMADGGDGLADVIRFYTGAAVQEASVADPLGRTIRGQWLLAADGKTAFIEMANVSGLSLLHRNEYNPLLTSTMGTGQLVKAACEKGVATIILGIGGSATNDCGIGMAAALGFRFLDSEGNPVEPVGGNLGKIRHIDSSNTFDCGGVQFQVACDVKNPLVGRDGATLVYAPQKGADAAMVTLLEEGMQSFAAVIKNDLLLDVTDLEGGGAAGGMGAGCVAFLGAELVSGIDLVMQLAGLEHHMQTADVVISGEGKVDGQTLQGKVVAGVASLAKKNAKKMLVFCGSQGLSTQSLQSAGINAVFPIVPSPMGWEKAKENAFAYLREAAYNVGSLLAS